MSWAVPVLRGVCAVARGASRSARRFPRRLFFRVCLQKVCPGVSLVGSGSVFGKIFTVSMKTERRPCFLPTTFTGDEAAGRPRRALRELGRSRGHGRVPAAT
jgi:hypothetical protein